MGEFRMPALGADMTEGTLLEWHVKPGQTVQHGQIVAVVDTDKAAIEVEVFEDGVVEELLVEPGTRVPVGTPLARLTAVGAPAVAPSPSGPASVVATPASEASRVESPLVRHLAHERGVDLTSVHGTGSGGVITRGDVDAAANAVPLPRAPSNGVRASPLARRRAAEMGIDLALVAGSGPGGAVTLGDVEGCRRSAAPPAPPVEQVGVEVTAPHVTSAGAPEADRNLAMRRAIGQLMARSKREVPHYYLSATIDLSQAMAWLHQVNASRPVADRLVAAALLLKASALATRVVPEVNGFWIDDRLEVSGHVHLGVAVSLRPAGLVAPAILDADTLDLDALMARLRDLVSRARAGRLRQQEMTAGTLTVTNLGDTGVDAVYGVIYPPQVALVGFGRVADRPWAQNGLLGVRPVVTATLSADHRASDGHRGSRYLSALDDILQRPEGL